MDLLNFCVRLKESSQNLLDTIALIDPVKLTIRDADSWSVLEILEHIYLTDKIIFTLISTPTDHLWEGREIIGIENLEKLVIGKNIQKVAAPEVVYPKGSIQSIDAFKSVFLVQREQLQTNLESGKIIVDNRIFKHPYLGKMTIEDWLNLMVFHTSRHIQQIEAKQFLQ